MLVAGLLARALIEQRVSGDTELRTDEVEHGSRDHLTRLYQATGIPKSAELEREAEPVARSAPAPDVNEIGIAQDAVAKRGLLRVRQAEQGGALPGGKNGTARHGRIFRRIRSVYAALIAIQDKMQM